MSSVLFLFFDNLSHCVLIATCLRVFLIVFQLMYVGLVFLFVICDCMYECQRVLIVSFGRCESYNIRDQGNETMKS